MNRDFLVYLAGPITGTTFGECTDWREYVKSKFPPNIIGLSPMRGKDYISHEGPIKHDYEGYPLSSAKGITARDTFDVTRSDLIFVNLLGATKVSIGTVLEIGMAHILNKQIVVVMEEKGNPHEHAMIADMTKYLLFDLDEAINLTSLILLPD